MTGEELYELYQQAMKQEANCGTDDFEDLSFEDQNVWEVMALRLKDKFA